MRCHCKCRQCGHHHSGWQTWKTTVLVVDDEDYVRKLLQRIFEENGYSVVTASNGYEALERLTQYKVELVLLDIKMPGLNGFSVLERIRKTSNVPK